jgi:hypothetical protein
MEALYVYVATDPKTGVEGFIGIPSRPGQPPSMAVGYDRESMLGLAQTAKAFADEHGVKVELVRFKTREALLGFLPRGKG